MAEYDWQKPRRVKITEPGWAGYTGEFGQTWFKDGVSVDPLSTIEQNRLGGLVRMESAEDSENSEQVGQNADYLRAKDQSNQETSKTENEDGSTVIHTNTKNNHENVSVQDERVYNKSDLEAVADKSGIGGLREVAKNFGVVGSSINVLMEKILKAQEDKNPKTPEENVSNQTTES